MYIYFNFAPRNWQPLSERPSAFSFARVLILCSCGKSFTGKNEIALGRIERLFSRLRATFVPSRKNKNASAEAGLKILGRKFLSMKKFSSGAFKLFLYGIRQNWRTSFKSRLGSRVFLFCLKRWAPLSFLVEGIKTREGEAGLTATLLLRLPRQAADAKGELRRYQAVPTRPHRLGAFFLFFFTLPYFCTALLRFSLEKSSFFF